MDSPGARLRATRLKAGFESARSASRRYGWNEETYRGHETGHREISKKALFKYAAAYNVDPMWLLTGVTGASGGENGDQARKLRTIPIVPMGAVEAMSLGTEHALNAARIGTLETDREGQGIFVVRIEDDAMDNDTRRAICIGDELVLDPEVPCAIGDAVVVLAKTWKEAKCRVLAEASPDAEGNERVRLLAYNPNREPIIVLRRDLVFMYPVADRRTRFKR